MKRLIIGLVCCALSMPVISLGKTSMPVISLGKTVQAKTTGLPAYAYKACTSIQTHKCPKSGYFSITGRSPSGEISTKKIKCKGTYQTCKLK